MAGFLRNRSSQVHYKGVKVQITCRKDKSQKLIDMKLLIRPWVEKIPKCALPLLETSEYIFRLSMLSFVFFEGKIHVLSNRTDVMATEFFFINATWWKIHLQRKINKYLFQKFKIDFYSHSISQFIWKVHETLSSYVKIFLWNK